MANKHEIINPPTNPKSKVKAADPEALARAEGKSGKGLSAKALRKLRRKADNEALAKEARFWRKEQSALQLGHNKPVNRQAAKDLSHKGPKKR